MNIQGDDKGVGVSMDQSIYVYKSNHETRRATIGVFVNSLQVLQYRDGWGSDSMERIEAVS